MIRAKIRCRYARTAFRSVTFYFERVFANILCMQIILYRKKENNLNEELNQTSRTLM